MLETIIRYININILYNCIPYENTLKNKSSINKLIISSHGVELVRLLCEMMVYIFIAFDIHFEMSDEYSKHYPYTSIQYIR